jgi:hypothetical protein
VRNALITLALISVASSAYAQTGSQMPSGSSAPPPGTTTPGTMTAPMPPSTTNTARPGALDSTNVTAAEAAARAKIQSAGYSDIKGLTRATDGTWFLYLRRDRAVQCKTRLHCLPTTRGPPHEVPIALE